MAGTQSKSTSHRAKRPRVNRDDGYFTKLVKYIPTEVITAYAAMSGLIKSLPENQRLTWFSAAGAGLLILTPLYVLYAANIKGEPLPYNQAVISTIAFAAWVFASGGPFEEFSWYSHAVGSIALIIVCVTLPLIEWLLPASHADHPVNP